jgi:hypothetical protein
MLIHSLQLTQHRTLRHLRGLAATLVRRLPSGLLALSQQIQIVERVWISHYQLTFDAQEIQRIPQRKQCDFQSRFHR